MSLCEETIMERYSFCKYRNAYRIEEVENPVYGFKYNIQLLSSVDDGETWYYSGVGQFVQTLKEAENIARYWQADPWKGAN